MIRFTFVCVGKLKEEYMKAAVRDYTLRLSRYAKTEFIEVPDSSVPEEGRALLAKIPSRSYAVALDLHGTMLSSEKLAEALGNAMNSGFSDICIVIGGSDGIDRQVTDRADLRLSLSPMTFTHLMTRLIVLEQFYRSMKILNGEKYHK